MPAIILLFITGLILYPTISRAQDLSFYQYDTKDGLAGSVVHGITQDNDGFIWFATETGLSRFDGKRFRNFTSNDGLPNNEVFLTFADSKNRIWIATFKNAVCYYYQGTIYNQYNDSVLRKITRNDHIKGFYETTKGEILISIADSIFVIAPSFDSTWWIPDRNNIDSSFRKRYQLKRFSRAVGGIPFFSVSNEVQQLIANKDTCFAISANKPGADSTSYIITTQNGYLIIPSGGISKNYYIDNHGEYSHCVFYDHRIAMLVSRKRTIQFFDIETGREVDMGFPDCRAHDIFKDREGNTWLSTDGQGVYKFSSSAPVRYTFAGLYHDEGVVQLLKGTTGFLVVTAKGNFWKMLREPLSSTKYTPQKIPAKISYLNRFGNRVIHLDNAVLNNLFGRKLFDGVVKTYFHYKDTAIIALAGHLLSVKVSQAKILDTLQQFTRITCASTLRGTYYWGTLDAIYALKSGDIRPIRYPLSGNRITTMFEGPDSTLWVASSGGGVAGIKNNQVVAVINSKTSNLSSDVCLSLFASDRYLWIGTAKGINKIDLSAKNYPLIARYGYGEGLQSEIINTLLVENDTVYTGTPAGLFVFDERNIPRHSYCNIAFTDIVISGKSYWGNPGTSLELTPEKNHIRFEFSGISFSSGNQVTYEYRLLGLNTDWLATTDQSLEFNSLPAGTYTLQVKALNKFGDESRIIEKRFNVAPLFWERSSVKGIAAVLFVVAITGAFRRRVILARKKEREKYDIERKLADMKHTALRAQINPHFIFNCLNSIQHFVLSNKPEIANFYIGRFSGLIRNTLENASLLYIPLTKEVIYLKSYLELEQMQLTPSFRFSFKTPSLPDMNHIYLPNMVIQPFVENAVKHGVQHLGDKGFISIDFFINTEDGTLVCAVKDNGPGILQTDNSSFPKQEGDRKSKGIALTEERILMLNQINPTGRSITLQKQWSYIKGDKQYGTQIILIFPI